MSKRNIKSIVLKELESIKFPKCTSRKNISSTSMEAFALGEVNYRGQAFLDYKTRGPSRCNSKFPVLYELIQKLIHLYHPTFAYTTIQVNKNVCSSPHVDKNNVGPSYIIGLGDYTGGDLCIEGKKCNIKNRWKLFDGTKGHWVEPFDGTRFSLVFFTHTFKPPPTSLSKLVITTDGIYNNKILLKKY